MTELRKRKKIKIAKVPKGEQISGRELLRIGNSVSSKESRLREHVHPDISQELLSTIDAVTDDNETKREFLNLKYR